MITASRTLNSEAALRSEPDLIHSAQRGDSLAYGELVSRHRDGVVRVVYRMCGDPHLAEEAAQEAFLRAWQHLAGYKTGHSFRAWVYRIALNAALDVLRARKPTTPLEALAEDRLPLESAGANPEATVEQRQRAERVQQAVMALPAPSRSVLVLREWGGLSYAEIANSLSIPIGTVMSRLNSARAQLRQSLVGLLEVV
jgi:RNA polymerase sigma-70 factor, ECF subfamily